MLEDFGSLSVLLPIGDMHYCIKLIKTKFEMLVSENMIQSDLCPCSAMHPFRPTPPSVTGQKTEIIVEDEEYTIRETVCIAE